MESTIEYDSHGIHVDGNFISLAEITKNCRNIEISEKQLVVYQIYHPPVRGWDGLDNKVLIPLHYAKSLDVILPKLDDIYLENITGKYYEVIYNYENYIHTTTSYLDDREYVLDFSLKYPSNFYYGVDVFIHIYCWFEDNYGFDYNQYKLDNPDTQLTETDLETLKQILLTL